ncbi:tripartite tricarboxylate transporter TctB family protein [Pseudotabrizicola alkalilacus]|uniref:Tripartite tricarboxylate transporter TctB family protein n=1 Tax=Pseudotabrizicola alkalilacus TaxID=2305252 RepID=A0A411Z4L9_9RHOB|nr:tripartite tricarboxylate transporter TctB family protein [Pseudotabrizicola alkalilacus]RGP38021.1 tripartite tricarboxylate transporter TctB family protein [Pseudotabrizicola alkalilacus]
MAESKERGRTSRLELNELRLAMWLCDLAGSGILLWVFWIYLQHANALRRPLNAADIGAGGFPGLLALIAIAALLLLLGIIIFRHVVTRRRASLVIQRPLFVVMTMALLVGQAILFDRIGAIVCVGGFSLAILLACGERRPMHLVGVPVALTAFIYAVFVLALGVKLP